MQSVAIAQLSPGARLARPIYGSDGRPLLNAGVELTWAYIDELRDRGVTAAWVEDPDTADVAPAGAISDALHAQVMGHLGASFSRVAAAAERLGGDGLTGVSRELRRSRLAAAAREAMGEADLVCLTGDIDQMIDELRGCGVVAGLNSLKSHDSYTFQHSIDVTVMGLVLARGQNWDRRRLRAFGLGCLLHDIGKLFVDRAILGKRDGLTPQEIAQVRLHPSFGFDLVREIVRDAGGVLAAHVAFQHHERQDGTGYPRGLRGTNALGRREPGAIHDFGSVAAVADVYDAMTSARPYRAGWSPARTLAMLRENAGTHFNTQVVRVMLDTVPPFPVLSNVRVTTGAHAGWRGVVTGVAKPHLTRPTVRLLHRPDGQRVDPVEIDLRREADVSVRADEPNAAGVKAAG